MNSFASPQTLVTLPFPPPDDLYSRVFDAILEQQIHPCSRITEESLGQMFGVRRSDIRSVLTRLSHQQVIILRANHRPRVATLDLEQTRQTLHARRLTEVTLVQLACQQADPHDLQGMRVVVDRLRLSAKRGPAIRLAGEFHLRLAEIAGNAPLAHFLGSLVPLTSLAIAQFSVPMEGNCVWQEHQNILEAVERKDTVRALSLLNRHLDYLEATLMNAAAVVHQNRVAG